MVARWLPFFQKKRKTDEILEPVIKWAVSPQNAEKEGEKPDSIRLFALSMLPYLPCTSVKIHSSEKT